MPVEILASVEFKHYKSKSSVLAGVVLCDDVVIEVAPIIGFMKGWTREKVRNYCKDHGWDVKVIYRSERRDLDGKD